MLSPTLTALRPCWRKVSQPRGSRSPLASQLPHCLRPDILCRLLTLSSTYSPSQPGPLPSLGGFSNLPEDFFQAPPNLALLSMAPPTPWAHSDPRLQSETTGRHTLSRLSLETRIPVQRPWPQTRWNKTILFLWGCKTLRILLSNLYSEVKECKRCCFTISLVHNFIYENLSLYWRYGPSQITRDEAQPEDNGLSVSKLEKSQRSLHG